MPTPDHSSNAFEAWFTSTFQREGAFTMFLIIMEQHPTTVTPLFGTYLQAVGGTLAWSDLVDLLDTAETAWDIVAVFAGQDANGELFGDDEANVRMRELEAALLSDRLVLQKGELFDKWGRAMQIERMYDA